MFTLPINRQRARHRDPPRHAYLARCEPLETRSLLSGTLPGLDIPVISTAAEVDPPEFPKDFTAPSGNPTREVHTYACETGGFVEITGITTNTYDRRGRLLTSTYEQDSSGDHIIDQWCFAQGSYDKRGRLTGWVRAYDIDGNGSWDACVQATNTYNNRGKLTATDTLYDYNMDGWAEARQLQTNSYDSRGRLNRYVITQDTNADNTWDDRLTYEANYNSRGKLVAWSYTLDEGADGIFDQHVSFTAAYNSRGKITTLTEFDDLNGDGVPEQTISSLATYDRKGHLTAMAMDVTNHLGVVVAHADYAAQYNKKGHCIAWTQTFDTNNCGTPEARIAATESHDNRGRLLHTVISTDDDMDLVAEAVETRTLTYA